MQSFSQLLMCPVNVKLSIWIQSSRNPTTKYKGQFYPFQNWKNVQTFHSFLKETEKLCLTVYWDWCMTESPLNSEANGETYSFPSVWVNGTGKRKKYLWLSYWTNTFSLSERHAHLVSQAGWPSFRINARALCRQDLLEIKTSKAESDPTA